MGSTVPNFGHASSNGLGPGIAEASSAAREHAQHQKPKPKPMPAPDKPAGQFADAPYKMGSDAGAGASQSSDQGGVDA